MSKKIIFSTQIFLFILCFSCEQENGSSSDYTKTIDDYEKLIDYAEKDNQDGVIEKLEDLGAEDKFHLQKLAKNQKESSTIIKLSELILSGKFEEASTSLNDHVRENGISPSLEEIRTTLESLQEFENNRHNAQEGKLSKEELVMIEKSLTKSFPKKNLNTVKMQRWFKQQYDLIDAKLTKRLKRLHTISLLQLDQINTELDFESKAGAEIYYRELNNLKPAYKMHQNLQKSIINLHTNLKSSPASVSEAVLQIYKRSSKQKLANTIIDLNEIESGTVIANSLKDRILRSALSSKNIQLEKFTKSPLLNLPTLMEIIIKSEE